MMQAVNKNPLRLVWKKALRINPARIIKRAIEDETTFLCSYGVPSKAVKATVACSESVFYDDTSLVARILTNYRRLANDGLTQGDSMWTDFFNRYHKEIHEAFITGDTKAGQNILRFPATNNLFYGFDSLALFFTENHTSGRLSKVSKKRLKDAKQVLGSLAIFSQAIGVRPVKAIDKKSKPFDENIVLDELEKFLRLKLLFPNPYPQEYGLKTRNGIASSRAIQALYQAYRVKSLLNEVEKPKVLEIGAGLGRTAYYASAFGITDYTIVDLPLTLAAQAYFLGCTLGEDRVVFLPEVINNTHKTVSLLSMKEFIDSNAKYDLILNVDSITEMDLTIAKQYADAVSQRCKSFISINHEMNSFFAKDLFLGRSNIINYSRYPYWMRAGYVEEIFTFAS
jgi:hypothetical protein